MTQCMVIAGKGQNQDKLEEMLSAYGFDLSAPANANEALAQCNTTMPDVIVVPKDLDDMDAVSFLKMVKRTGAGEKAAVFLCADKPDSEKMGQAIWEGASDFLIEPYDAEVLDCKLKQAGLV